MLSWLKTLFASRERWGSNGPVCSFDDIKEGELVRVTGRAKPDGAPWLLPFSGREAASWTWRSSRLEQQGEMSRRNAEWVVVDDIDHGQTFWIEDEDGKKVRIDRGGYSTLFNSVTYGVQSEPGERENAAMEEYFERYGRDQSQYFHGFGSEHRYLEQAIPVNGRVTVVGKARFDEGTGPTAAGYRDAPITIVIEPPDTEKLKIWVER